MPFSDRHVSSGRMDYFYNMNLPDRIDPRLYPDGAFSPPRVYLPLMTSIEIIELRLCQWRLAHSIGDANLLPRPEKLLNPRSRG